MPTLATASKQRSHAWKSSRQSEASMMRRHLRNCSMAPWWPSTCDLQRTLFAAHTARHSSWALHMANYLYICRYSTKLHASKESKTTAAAPSTADHPNTTNQKIVSSAGKAATETCNPRPSKQAARAKQSKWTDRVQHSTSKANSRRT